MIFKINTNLLENSAAEKLLNPAYQETEALIIKFYKSLPYLASAILILVVFLIFSKFFYTALYRFIERRKSNVLVANAIAKGFTSIIIIIGLYLSLKTTGLTGLAFTVLGGTGIIGLGIGFALKGTFENYAAGIIISLKDIFRTGELVKINDYEGVIQSVTTRGTTIMDYDGNSIILPNSAVLSSSIKNLTRNPKMRLTFNVGIGYDDPIDHVRQLILDFFNNHKDKVILNPEPQVQVMSLGSATVNLSIYFWIDTTVVSQTKIRSWALQRVKEILMENQISMPDDAREIVFASPLQIQNTVDKKADLNDHSQKKMSPQVTSSQSENLSSDLDDLRKQALSTDPAESGDSLI